MFQIGEKYILYTVYEIPNVFVIGLFLGVETSNHI